MAGRGGSVVRRQTWWLVWILLIPVLAVTFTPEPAAAASCDADGDGSSGGSTTEWLTNGDDRAARRLADDAGRTFGAAPAGYRWEVPVCVEGDAVRVTGPQRRVLAPDARAWEARAIGLGTGGLAAKMWRPAPRITPDVNGMQVVELETWLAIDPTTWVPVSHTEVYGEVVVYMTATPVSTIWTFSDGVFRCNGPGVEYTPGAVGPAPCGRDWDHTTSVAPMSMSVVIEYDVTWTSSIGGAGRFVQAGSPLATYDLAVGEIQAIGALGDQASPSSPGLLPDPDDLDLAECTLRMLTEGLCSNYEPESEQGGSECSAGSIFHPTEWDDCVKDAAGVVIDGVEWVVDNVVELALQIEALLPPWAKAIVDFFKGCAAFGIEVLSGLWQAAKEVASALGNPVSYVTEKLQEFQDLYAAIQEDPRAFAEEFLGELAELQLLEDEPAQWIGKMGCELAAAVITAGAAGGSGRVAKLLDKMDDIRDWVTNRRRHRGDRDGGNDSGSDNDGRDRDPITCRTGGNSFPTGTEVLMADGSHLPIDLIEPGDRVMAADVATGVWSARTVVDQWSHLDRGSMATATLADGSQITATDHHLFWVASDGTWRELEDVAPGDHLLTPDGVTTVDAVEVTGPRSTLVWELDVAVDDTFTVSSGTADVLVHNAPCGRPGSSEHRDSAWDEASSRNPSMTRAEFDARYDALYEAIGDLPDNFIIEGVDPVTGLPVVVRTTPTPDFPDGEFIDLRTPELLRERVNEIFADGQGDLVLGRFDDAALAGAEDGKFALNVDDWSPELNDSVIQHLIDDPRPVDLATNPFDPSVDGSIFEHEIQQLSDAGWLITENRAYPPGSFPDVPTPDVPG